MYGPGKERDERGGRRVKVVRESKAEEMREYRKHEGVGERQKIERGALRERETTAWRERKWLAAEEESRQTVVWTALEKDGLSAADRDEAAWPAALSEEEVGLSVEREAARTEAGCTDDAVHVPAYTQKSGEFVQMIIPYLSASDFCKGLAALGQSFSPLLRGENPRSPSLPRLFGWSSRRTEPNRRGLRLQVILSPLSSCLGL